ncbi:hypothetical protein FUA48_04635 [Flavobacterium alkalisoli]|uniref:Uncharacterized protein n=1 Tax=Flavobacterium alkalisoli TaxID=2602769 RepID=A0A5B9FS18_9FLAO|nr:hypothetical protein [Flavobacterium alkalisoli]QEE48886.1 hypothetical protein FUA48_04635 [Flavobacterium alkalisoli]
MKKILFFLLLFPLTVSAKFYDGTITLSNGSVKMGMVEIPKHSKSKNIRFKSNEKAKAVNVEIKGINGFTIFDDGKTYNYMTLKLANIKTFKKEFNIDDEVAWVRVESEGTISIVVAYTKSLDGYVGPVYYLHKKGEDHCKYLTVFYADNMFHINEFANIKYMCKIIFKDSCPELVENLSKDAFKEKGLVLLNDLYNEYCGE